MNIDLYRKYSTHQATDKLELPEPWSSNSSKIVIRFYVLALNFGGVVCSNWHGIDRLYAHSLSLSFSLRFCLWFLRRQLHPVFIHMYLRPIVATLFFTNKLCAQSFHATLIGFALVSVEWLRSITAISDIYINSLYFIVVVGVCV